MNTPAVLTLDLVRHGTVRTPGLLCAAPDEPLSSEGWRQMRGLKSRGNWDAIISSPSLRCSRFAAELSEHLDIPLSTDPAWRELDFGSWTGKQREILWQTERERMLRLWSDPLRFTAPGGEGMADFVARVFAALAALLKHPPGSRVLLITHAGVIRAILVKVLGIDYIAAQRFNIGHARVNRIQAFADGEFSLLKWGEKPALHIPGALS